MVSACQRGKEFVTIGLCLRRQIFMKLAKRSAVFVVAVETIHSVVDKLGTSHHTLKNVLARVLGNIVQKFFCQSDRKLIMNINRGATKVPRGF